MKNQISDVTDKEYDKLIKRLEFFDTMRNNLLTFSFTAVLTVLGVAMTVDMDSKGSWICLIPFFLIIPFAARISYYRLASAHINSFLKEFAQVDMGFERGTEDVPESICKGYKLLAWLVNHEMVLLGMATSCTFFFKYFISIDGFKPRNCIGILVPVILTIIVYKISHSTYDYQELKTNFSVKWREYAAGKKI